MFRRQTEAIGSSLDAASDPATAEPRLRISRFRPGMPDEFAEVDMNWPDLLRGITAVGGGYGDAVATLRMAKEQGVLTDQLAFDPLPKFQRTYYRVPTDSDTDDSTESE